MGKTVDTSAGIVLYHSCQVVDNNWKTYQMTVFSGIAWDTCTGTEESTTRTIVSMGYTFRKWTYIPLPMDI